MDNFGLYGHWRPAAGPKRFEPASWLAARDDWDDEDIGLLAHPPPPPAELQAVLVRYYREIGDLDDDERRFAQCDAGDRAAVIAAICRLPGSALVAEALW